MNEKDNKIELLRILHLLKADDKTFDFLSKLNAEELQQLRIKMSEVIEIDQPDIWNRIAKVAKFMPNFLNAKVAETVLGPMLTANLSSYVPVKDGLSIMKNLSSSFLAEVSEYMVPEKSYELINEIPIDILKKITSILIRNKKHFIVSNFVNVLDTKKVILVSEAIYDELDLILISEFIEDKALIARIIEGFSDSKLKNIIQKAYANNKQEDILSVFPLLNQIELKRVLGIVKHLPDSEQETILADLTKRLK